MNWRSSGCTWGLHQIDLLDELKDRLYTYNFLKGVLKKVNGIDCWRIVFYFKKDRLAQVKIDVTASGQKQMFAQLTTEYGPPKLLSRDDYGVPIVGWISKNGVILTNNRPYTLVDWIKELHTRPAKVLDQFITNQFLWINRKDVLYLY